MRKCSCHCTRNSWTFIWKVAVSSHHPSLGRINRKWNSEGDWDNGWHLQGVTNRVWVVQHSRADVRALLSVGAVEGRILHKWKEIFGQQNDYKLSQNTLKLEQGGLWASEQPGSARPCIRTAGPGSHCVTHIRKGLHVKLWKWSLAGVIISSPICSQNNINFFC